mgnify:CR=1 FL=1
MNQSVKNFLLTQDLAVLSFGSQRFRLRVLEHQCTIQVDVEGKNPRAALKRLMEQVQVIIQECMKALTCFSAVAYSPSGKKHAVDEGVSFDENTFLIPLTQIKSVVESHFVLNRPGGRRLLSEEEALTTFSEWIGGQRQGGPESRFDLFLSYRWGASDSMFVQCLYDRFSLHTLGAENREVVVFLDKECLQDGR